MSVEHRSARTRSASGRFLVLLLLAACQTVGGGAGVGDGPGGPTDPGDEPAVVVPTTPVIVGPGEISGDEEEEAAALWAAALRSFEARRFFEVLRTTDELLQRFPASEVSGEALRLSAEAELELGRWNRADQAAERYLGLLEPGDPRAVPMRLLQARALPDDPAARLDRLLRIEDVATDAQLAEAEPMVRDAADALTWDGLRAVREGVPMSGPLAPLVDARLAVSLLEVSQEEAAAAYARRAVDGGATGEELAWAEGVLRGELPEGRGRVTAFSIGLVLPFGGPPALSEYASLVQEGVEVAVRSVLGDEYTVTLVSRDDEGDPVRTAAAVAELEAQGVAGIIGLLQDDVLIAAGEARADTIPLVSPSARSAGRAGPGVYSLDGADPRAAESVARYAASRAFQRIAVVHPRTPEAEVEVDAFEAVAERLGMPVVGRFAYEAGVTFFEPQIRAARDALRRPELDSLYLSEDDTLRMQLLEPAAIFLPIPPEDVEFLAPQLIHFGLDTLAIELLGTTGWTDPDVLAVVDPRVMNGVVATAALEAGAGASGDLRFREAYEEAFQRSLVGATPALGYDAALLLLEALRPGRIDREEVRRSIERLSAVEGATGVFSVVDGRIVRSTEVVRIQNGTPVPEPAGWPDSLDLPGGYPLVPADTLAPGDTLGAPVDTLAPIDTLGVPVDTLAPIDTLRPAG